MPKRYREPWGQCDYCGFDVPASRIVLTKYGWQCTGAPGANCYDHRPDGDDYMQALRFKSFEGVRKTSAPVTNTLTEGTENEADTGFGSGGFGDFPLV